jgi:histidine triad (HIT) family protein
LITDIFCKIINKELPAEIVMEGEDWIAINDINPQAPVHVLIVPKKHFDFPDVKDEDRELVGQLIIAAKTVAQKLKLEKGFRIIINRGEHGGQLVPHFHIHLLGGRRLGAKIVADVK